MKRYVNYVLLSLCTLFCFSPVHAMQSAASAAAAPTATETLAQDFLSRLPRLPEAFKQKLDAFFGDYEVYAALIARPRAQTFFGNEHLAAPSPTDTAEVTAHHDAMFEKLCTESEDLSNSATLEQIRKRYGQKIYNGALQNYNQQVNDLAIKHYDQKIHAIFAKHRIQTNLRTGSNLVFIFQDFPQYVVKIPIALWASKYQILSRVFAAKVINDFIRDQNLRYIRPTQKYLYRIPHEMHPDLAWALQASWDIDKAFFPVKQRVNKWLTAINTEEFCDANYIVIAENINWYSRPGTKIDSFSHAEELRKEITQVIDHARQWDITTDNVRITVLGRACFIDTEQPGQDRSTFHEGRDKDFLDIWTRTPYEPNAGMAYLANIGRDKFGENFR